MNVIKQLGLKNVHVIDQDWRTFLRKTHYPIDLFCARASLAPEELIRIFKPSCPYNGAALIYWASTSWQADAQVAPFVEKEVPYTVGNKKRKFVFLRASSKTIDTVVKTCHESNTMKTGLVKSFVNGINDYKNGETYSTIIRYFLPELVTTFLLNSLPWVIDCFLLAVWHRRHLLLPQVRIKHFLICSPRLQKAL